jgi:hypothetical protein
VSRSGFRVGKGSRRADIRQVRARYAIGGILVAASLAFPASAAAGQGGQVASMAAQQCAQQKADIGRKAFRKHYGAKHTMRNCVRRNRAKAASTLTSAAQECEQELAEVGSAEFIFDYAFDEDTVENAMSECIAETVDEALNPDDSDGGENQSDGEDA